MAKREVYLPKLAGKGHFFKVKKLSKPAWQNLLRDNPDTPKNYIDLLSQARSYFFGHNLPLAQGGAGVGAPVFRKSGTELLMRIEDGFSNPEITPAQIEKIDEMMSLAVPVFNKTTETNHFVIKWTDNSGEPRDNSTQATIDALGETLEAAYTLYTGALGQSPYLGKSAVNKKILVQVYYMPGLGGSTSPDGALNLDAQHMAGAHTSSTVAVHELFHRYTYSFGFRVKYAKKQADSWFYEGVCDWASLYATAGWTLSEGDLTWCFSNINKPFFADISYYSPPAWMFLQGFERDTLPDYPIWTIKSFLDNYSGSGDALGSFEKVCKSAKGNSLSVFFNEFTLARASDHWKMQGIGYERNKTILDYAVLHCAATGRVIVPVVIYTERFGFNKTQHSMSWQGFSIDVSAANLYRFSFDPALNGKTLNVTLRCLTKKGTVYGSSALIKSNKELPYSRYPAAGGSDIKWKVVLDLNNYDFMVLAVTNGQIKPKNGGDIRYNLWIDIDV